VTGAQPTVLPASHPPEQAIRQSTPAVRSIAVLPFTNLSPNENDAYFAVGIHEEILNQLTKLGSLRVVASTSVQRYAATQKSIPEIARELNVETVMEGSVRYADGRVLVTTQLIDGATDAHVWSDSYERDFSNIFAIQSDIALKVAQALKAALLPAERERVRRAPTTSLQAYDLYLSASARDRRNTRDDILLGIQEVDQALALDPDFALAWALKSSLSTVAQVFDPAHGAEHQLLGEQAARRALEIDPMLGAAHAALGFSLTQKADWRGSEAAFRRALSLNRPLGDMPSYSVLQLSVGNFGYAREILQETREVVPQNPAALGFLMMANALLGDWATATAQFDFGTRFFAPWSGDNLMMHMRIARDGLEAARGIPSDDPIDRVMLANLDTPQSARRELRRMHVDPALADPVSQKGIATWAADFGDAPLALDAIRSAATQRGANIVQVWLPQFAEARKLPGFKALLRDLGIVAYWREYGWQAVCRPLGADDFECH
jgi:TolB-like protein/Tfp pilus assembly protein PilF